MANIGGLGVNSSYLCMLLSQVSIRLHILWGCGLAVAVNIMPMEFLAAFTIFLPYYPFTAFRIPILTVKIDRRCIFKPIQILLWFRETTTLRWWKRIRQSQNIKMLGFGGDWWRSSLILRYVWHSLISVQCITIAIYLHKVEPFILTWCICGLFYYLRVSKLFSCDDVLDRRSDTNTWK